MPGIGDASVSSSAAVGGVPAFDVTTFQCDLPYLWRTVSWDVMVADTFFVSRFALVAGSAGMWAEAGDLPMGSMNVSVPLQTGDAASAPALSFSVVGGMFVGPWSAEFPVSAALSCSFRSDILFLELGQFPTSLGRPGCDLFEAASGFFPVFVASSPSSDFLLASAQAARIERPSIAGIYPSGISALFPSMLLLRGSGFAGPSLTMSLMAGRLKAGCVFSSVSSAFAVALTPGTAAVLVGGSSWVGFSLDFGAVQVASGQLEVMQSHPFIPQLSDGVASRAIGPGTVLSVVVPPAASVTDGLHCRYGRTSVRVSPDTEPCTCVVPVVAEAAYAASLGRPLLWDPPLPDRLLVLSNISNEASVDPPVMMVGSDPVVASFGVVGLAATSGVELEWPYIGRCLPLQMPAGVLVAVACQVSSSVAGFWSFSAKIASAAFASSVAYEVVERMHAVSALSVASGEYIVVGQGLSLTSVAPDCRVNGLIAGGTAIVSSCAIVCYDTWSGNISVPEPPSILFGLSWMSYASESMTVPLFYPFPLPEWMSQRPDDDRFCNTSSVPVPDPTIANALADAQIVPYYLSISGSRVGLTVALQRVVPLPYITVCSSPVQPLWRPAAVVSSSIIICDFEVQSLLGLAASFPAVIFVSIDGGSSSVPVETTEVRAVILAAMSSIPVSVLPPLPRPSAVAVTGQELAGSAVRQYQILVESVGAGPWCIGLAKTFVRGAVDVSGNVVCRSQFPAEIVDACTLSVGLFPRVATCVQGLQFPSLVGNSTSGLPSG